MYPWSRRARYTLNVSTVSYRGPFTTGRPEGTAGVALSGHARTLSQRVNEMHTNRVWYLTRRFRHTKQLWHKTADTIHSDRTGTVRFYCDAKSQHCGSTEIRWNIPHAGCRHFSLQSQPTGWYMIMKHAEHEKKNKSTNLYNTNYDGTDNCHSCTDRIRFHYANSMKYAVRHTGKITLFMNAFKDILLSIIIHIDY